MDLSNLNIPELKQLRNDVDTLLAFRQKEAEQAAKAQILAIADSVGMPVAQLMELGAKQKKDSAKVAPKYRNPANAQEVWTGRGRAPTWALALQNAGTLENARIDYTGSDAKASA